MHVLILLLLALAVLLFISLQLYRKPDLRRYFYFFVVVDVWVVAVLVYLLTTAIFD